MKIKHLLIIALLAFTGNAVAQMTMPPLPVDKDVKIGKLDNGLTYYIRYNNWPEHRANFYIAQKVGSIQEEESQRDADDNGGNSFALTGLRLEE